MDFVGPLTPTKRGHSAILFVLDGFSKFVIFYPVRRISSQVVVDCLERNYFPSTAFLKLLLLTTRVFSDVSRSSSCALNGPLIMPPPPLITPKLR
jgi:hypothetical protein